MKFWENHVWVVIVTFNSTNWIKRCIESIRKSSITPRIIVVDNHSQDETINIITSLYPEVNILLSPENRGFGQACNFGMKYAIEAGAEYILQMNDDAELTPSVLSDLLNAAVKYPEFGILIPLNLTDDGTMIDLIFERELEKYHLPECYSDYIFGQMKEVYEVPVLPGGVLLVKRQLLEELGGFDPLFFVLGVEYDFCFRTTISKWKIGFVPHAVVHHEYNRSENQQNIQTITRYIADFYSTSLFILKRLDHSFPYMLLYEWAYYFYQIFIALKNKNWKRALAVVITAPKLLRVLPTVWRHRKLCLTQKGVFLTDISLPEVYKE